MGINIGLVGSGFMGLTHSLAYKAMNMFYPIETEIKLLVLADINEDIARSGAQRLGFEHWTEGWESIFDFDIDVVDIVTPNSIHPPIVAEAVKRGVQVICEKPLAHTLSAAVDMTRAVEEAGVTNMVCFNYRQSPAVRMAKKLIDEGELGNIHHFRGVYLQDWCVDPASPFVWRFSAKDAGSGSLGDIGSHVIDFARYLVGEITDVVATTQTFVKQRRMPTTGESRPVDVDDAVNVILRFESGVTGTIEASRFCPGRKNHLAFEINGSKGSLTFDWEEPNDLRFFTAEDAPDRAGFRLIKVGPAHPNAEAFWPIPGIGMAYVETSINQAGEFLNSVVDGRPASPSFRDGLKVALVMDAIQRSATTSSWSKVQDVAI